MALTTAASDLEVRKADHELSELVVRGSDPAVTAPADAFAAHALAERDRRLQADGALLLRLQLQGFQGREWERFRDRLARYGYCVIRSWIRTGKIFYYCRRAGFGGVPSRQIDRDGARELAMETAACALHFFEARVLRVAGDWDPCRGATLKTFFIGACTRAFGNVYERWRTENSAIGLGKVG
jgi:hypothetical protein